MSLVDERAAIEGRFQAQWALTAHSAVPVIYENGPEKPPSDDAHAMLYILNGAGQQVSLGTSPVDRYSGVIVVQLFVPKQEGTVEIRQMADAVETIFKRKQFASGAGGSIRCRLAEAGTVPNPGYFHQMNVSIPYQRDQQ